MPAACEQCGAPLGALGRLLGRRVCGACQRQSEQRQRQALADYGAALEQALMSSTSVPELSARLLPLRSGLPANMTRDLEMKALRAYLEEALKDDRLSAEEEERLNELLAFFGIDQEAFRQHFADYIPRLLVARINDGRLPELSPERAHVLVKKGEVVHLEAPAKLLKEVTARRGSYAGLSFRLARGVYFHTGQFRTAPRLELTLREVDSGTLAVTSQRVVFRGQHQGVEVQYKRLLGVDFYRDGLRLVIAGRSSSPLFQLLPEQVLPIGACINAAAQRHLQE